MEISKALKIFQDYQKSNLKRTTIIGYRYLIDNFEELFGDKDLNSISSEDIFGIQRSIVHQIYLARNPNITQV